MYFWVCSSKFSVRTIFDSDGFGVVFALFHQTIRTLVFQCQHPTVFKWLMFNSLEIQSVSPHWVCLYSYWGSFPQKPRPEPHPRPAVSRCKPKSGPDCCEEKKTCHFMARTAARSRKIAFLDYHCHPVVVILVKSLKESCRILTDNMGSGKSSWSRHRWQSMFCARTSACKADFVCCGGVR